MASAAPTTPVYDESSIKSLEWNEHIRLRPGMYIGKLGDGSTPDDGIYVLVKEIVDNSIDEFVMGAGKKIDIDIGDKEVRIRDWGRGIPLGKVIDCVSKINTGGKYDSTAFQKSVGLNGVGTKAVNALSSRFVASSYKDGRCKKAEFCRGALTKEHPEAPTKEKNGTEIVFEPDDTIFLNYRFLPMYLYEKVWNYAYLNTGLTITLNGLAYSSLNGLLDLVNKQSDDSVRYPVVHLRSADIECAFTHGGLFGEHIQSFVNGQNTTQGGTHLAAFREALVKAARTFYKKDFDAADVRSCIVGAVSVRIQEPVFESQTKTKLGSTLTAPSGGEPLKPWIVGYVADEVEKHLHRNPAVAKALLERILQSERERKEIAGIRVKANETAKRASMNNPKLRDCRVHLTDEKHPKRQDTMVFITEGESATGSIAKARDVAVQAVFSLKGKPKNSFGYTLKDVYANKEFNLLQHALDLTNGIDSLRFEKIIIATDADVDGKHIRLLMMTFFLQFFPEVVEQGHLYILQTPLFRVRNKKETCYCYTESEKDRAMARLGSGHEITRFKGLGEISPDEFAQFIGPGMRLDPVVLPAGASVASMLSYFMGENSQHRQDFIVSNLRLEEAP